MNPAKTIVLDYESVAGGSDSETVPGLKAYVERALATGSIVYLISGLARDPFQRQKLERWLELAGIRRVPVIHALPDHFDLFVSAHAYKFDGIFPAS